MELGLESKLFCFGLCLPPATATQRSARRRDPKWTGTSSKEEGRGKKGLGVCESDALQSASPFHRILSNGSGWLSPGPRCGPGSRGGGRWKSQRQGEAYLQSKPGTEGPSSRRPRHRRPGEVAAGGSRQPPLPHKRIYLRVQWPTPMTGPRLHLEGSLKSGFHGY